MQDAPLDKNSYNEFLNEFKEKDLLVVFEGTQFRLVASFFDLLEKYKVK